MTIRLSVCAGTLFAGLLAALALAALGNAATAAFTPGTSPACTAEVIGADTDVALKPDVVCSSGFAMALRSDLDPAVTTTTGVTTTSIETSVCGRADQCAFAELFHVTTSGWVHDGRHSRECAEDLGVAFISPAAAAAFAPVCNPSMWAAPPTVARGDRGLEVMYVQIALVSKGYDLAIDGTFGIATERALQALQAASGLAADGIANSETHAALGTGPNAPLPTTTTTTNPTTTLPPSPTTTLLSPPTTALVVGPGVARECSAAAIMADTGVAMTGDPSRCGAGWAVIAPVGCGGYEPGSTNYLECEDFDVFHVTQDGWVYDGTRYSGCAEFLAGGGLSPLTALAWIPWCNGEPPQRSNIEPGSTGDRVTSLQIALVALGYPIAVDGEYGPSTEAAVRDFQSRNGLEVDGIAGPNTQELLVI